MLKTKKIKLVVDRLQVHLKNQQRILIDSKNRMIEKQFQVNENLRHITFIEYFKVNKVHKNAMIDDKVFFYQYRDVVKNSIEYLYLDISFDFT